MQSTTLTHDDELAAAVEESRQKTTCPTCPSCQHYNADADGPLLEVNSDSAYECCPECWYRFERIA